MSMSVYVCVVVCARRVSGPHALGIDHMQLWLNSSAASRAPNTAPTQAATWRHGNVPPATGCLYLDIDAKPACCLAYHQVPPSLRQAKSCIMSHLSHPVVELAVRKLTTKRKRESDDGYVGMGMLGIAPIRAPLAIAVLSIWCNYIACRML